MAEAAGILALYVLSWALYRTSRQSQREKEESVREVDELKSALESAKTCRQDERRGRIAAEKKLRALLREHSTAESAGDIASSVTWRVIGRIESPFRERRGTPRQPALVSAACGRIRFDKKFIQGEHFAELTEFSHIWVVFQFHENTRLEGGDQSTACDDNDCDGDSIDSHNKSKRRLQKAPTTLGSAKIRPPRLHGKRVGCLSTRSPHRPNNVGLSVCEVIDVTSDSILIRGIDMIHGTPVLDGKSLELCSAVTRVIVTFLCTLHTLQ